MKIHINQVPDEGLAERATYDPAPLDMEREDIQLREPIAVEAKITLAASELVVAAGIHCPLRMTCARCLEEFDRPVDTEAVFSYKVKPTDVVDITEDVRQEIILAYPMVPTCRPDCKGLCRHCGRNLNTETCGHTDEPEGEEAGPFRSL